MPFQLKEVASFDGKSFESLTWFDQKIAAKPWNKASGGEKMRALLARAFASKAQLLLLDEPFNHLDAFSISAVRDAMLAYVTAPSNRSIIFVSHLENTKRKSFEESALIFPTFEVTPAAFRRGKSCE